MRILRLALTVIFLTCVVVPCHSDGSFFDIFRKLEQDSDASKLNAQVWVAHSVFYLFFSVSRLLLRLIMKNI